MTIEKIIKGICPSCKEGAEFEYKGYIPKDDEFEIEHTELYNCNKCHSTVTDTSVKNYTMERMYTARGWIGFEGYCATRVHSSSNTHNTKKVHKDD